MGGPPPTPTREELHLMSGAVGETVDELEARQNYGAPPPPPTPEELQAMEAATESEALETGAGLQTAPKKKEAQRAQL